MSTKRSVRSVQDIGVIRGHLGGPRCSRRALCDSCVAKCQAGVSVFGCPGLCSNLSCSQRVASKLRSPWESLCGVYL